MLALLKALAAVPQLAKFIQWVVDTWRAYEKEANVAEANHRAAEKRSSFADAIRAAQSNERVFDNSSAAQHSPGNSESPRVSGRSPSSS